MQKVVTVELQSHYHKDIEEPFLTFIEDGWKVVSLSSAASNLAESKAACWITALMEKDKG
jgi:hypothetical protein